MHRALRVRAAFHGRSTEAEVRAILEETTLPEERIPLGLLLTTVGCRARLTNWEFASFTQRNIALGQLIDLV